MNNDFITRLKSDFVLFLFVLWEALGLPHPTSTQIDIARQLQNSTQRRFILQAFRGVGKSFITCAYVVWRLWNNPQLKFLIVSASKERADANSIFIKKIIDLLPFLNELKPKPTQRDSVISFDVGPAKADHSPSVKSVGITGQMTGSRADIIIADDVETPNNSATQFMRDRLSELVKEFDAILKPDGNIIYLGTPQTEMTLYRGLEDRGYETLVWPARFPRDEADLASYGHRLAPTLREKLSDERCFWMPVDERFPEEDLTERELSYGRAGFALQFMLNPSLSDENKFPLKLKDLIVAPLDPETAPMTFQWLPNKENQVQNLPLVGLKGDSYHRYHQASNTVDKYIQRIMVIDPSGRGKDETGYAVLFTLNGYIYVMEVGGMRGGYEDTTLERLARIGKKWKVNEVVIESNFGDGMFSKLFQPVMLKFHQSIITEIRAKGQKEVRIAENLEPVMSSHRLVVREEAIQADYNTARDTDGKQDPKYSCFYQMSRLTRDRNSLAHDDRLDALALGVEHLKQVMQINAEKGQEEWKTEWLMKQMDEEFNAPKTHTITIAAGFTVSWEEDENNSNFLSGW